MTKIDFKKDLKQLYNPSAKHCVLIDVPPMNFLMLDGAGNPNTAPAFAEATETLYLSDPRRAAPEKMKTVIRQPVKPK